MAEHNELPDGRMGVKGAAAYLGVSESKLNQDRMRGRGPRFVRIGTGRGSGRVFYFRRDLDEYLRSCIVETVDSRKGAAA